MEENFPDVEEQIARLLQKKRESYLTVTQIRNGLPASVLKHFGLNKKRSGPADIIRKLKPYLRNMSEYKGSRTAYIGFRKSSDEIILDKIRRKPGISPKNLARILPMVKKEFIAGLNRLLESGDVICAFNNNYMPGLKIAAKIGEQISLENRPTDGRAAFKSAYNKVGKGKNFVRIHRIREHLNWPSERFERMLMDLMADYTVELHGGDPTTMTEKEIRDSFTDENGLLYINLTWWGKNDERE